MIDNNLQHHTFQGIQNSFSLQHISFAECKIGDEGCKYLVEVIKTKPNIGNMIFGVKCTFCE